MVAVSIRQDRASSAVCTFIETENYDNIIINTTIVNQLVTEKYLEHNSENFNVTIIFEKV